MDNDANAPGYLERVTYWQPDGVKRFLATSGLNYVGLMDDGRTVLK